ncbi:MAG: polysaccharide biosynthesis tyrosine autokinase [Candidatus Omnitrophota bacterium]|nr:polysaccharide biosynthesis tyrosine autokinase [Candidatus Omnitrophota bacterium]
MAQYELNIRDYWRILKKRRIIILLTFISSVIATAVYNNLQTPIYEASAMVRVEQRKTVIGALTERIMGYGGDFLLTEEKVIRSRPVIEEAARRLKLIDKNSSTEKIEEIVGEIEANIGTERQQVTSIIRITLTSSEPKRARDIVNKIAEVYVEENFRQRNKEAFQVREFIQKQLATVAERLKKGEETLRSFKEKETVSGIAVALENRLIALQGELADILTKATEKHPQVIRLREQIQDIQEQLKKLPKAEFEFARLKRDVSVNEKLYTMLREKFEEARINEAQQTADASIVNPAIEPKYPIRPNKKFALMVGSVVGLMMSFIFAFISESLDTSIGTIEDVESVLKLPVLAVIPSVKSEAKEARGLGKKYKSQKSQTEEDDLKVGLIVHLKPLSQMAESFRILRTNLKLSEQKKVLLITSTGPREGKSTVLMGLALTLAQMGMKTLVVDTDLRRPCVNKLLGIERDVGVNELLAGEVHLEDCIKGLTDIMLGKLGFDDAVKNPGLDNLHIITSGHIAHNPAELLGSKKMLSLIDELKDKFEVVLFDSPPVLSISDSAILAPKMDGVVLVYEMGRTARSALLRAKIQLETIGAKVLGVVLNHIRPETYLDTGYYPYYYHYKYKYYRTEEKENEEASKIKDTT